MTQKLPNEHREYSLHARLIESNPELCISEQEFNSLKQAKTCLSSAFALEENYDLLLCNYRELELEVIAATVSDMTMASHDYDDFFGVRTSINRRIINLLSTTRMYLDSYPRALKKAGSDSGAAKVVCAKVYDELFEYRFMEALRNYTQHEGFAVHSVKMDGCWLPECEPKQLQFSITPFALKSVLIGSDFKRSILDESPEQVPLIHAARVHIGGISSVHEKVRELIAPLVKEARCLFESAIARHEIAAKKQYVGLVALAKENGAITEKIQINLKWDDVRQKLSKRNPPVLNLAKRFVTSQVVRGKDE